MARADARLSYSIGRLSFYTPHRDKAIGIAGYLFGGGRRLGQAGYADADRDLRRLARTDSRDQAVIQY